jgi:hypothetical protein
MASPSGCQLKLARLGHKVCSELHDERHHRRRNVSFWRLAFRGIFGFDYGRRFSEVLPETAAEGGGMVIAGLSRDL